MGLFSAGQFGPRLGPRLVQFRFPDTPPDKGERRMLIQEGSLNRAEGQQS